jgi:hypothetical protein
MEAKGKKLADGSVSLDRMTQRQILVDVVTISAAELIADEDEFRFQIGDDSLHRSLSDSDGKSNFAQSSFRRPI